LAEQVMDLLPRFAGKEGVVAIGEIGYDEMTGTEEKYFRLQLELAQELAMPVMIHTPHRNKKAGTSRSMDVCQEHGLPPHRVVIDHNNEETVKEVLDRGFWAGFTIYPKTKMDSERMAAIVKRYGAERILVDSSADWGISDPLAVPKTARLMLEQGISRDTVETVCYRNALAAYGQSGRMSESDWMAGAVTAEGESFLGNSVARGQPKA
jgi:predicted metal-dependent TIM-barrel fold hydrolase